MSAEPIMQTDKEFCAKWQGRLETPQPMRGYLGKNC
jgi:hypothetical protein